MWVSNSDQTSAEAQALGAIFGFICDRCDNYVAADMGEYCGDTYYGSNAWLCFMCQETIAVFSENFLNNVECDCCGERKNLADGKVSLLRDAWICTACRASHIE